MNPIKQKQLLWLKMSFIHKILQNIVTYSVFISVENRDLKFAYKIRDYLRKYGASVFIYDEKILGGESWREKIKENLIDCDYFIVLLSKKSLNSADVRHEIGGAYFLQKDFLLVLLENIDSQELGMIDELKYVKYNDKNFFPNLRNKMLKVI